MVVVFGPSGNGLIYSNQTPDPEAGALPLRLMSWGWGNIKNA